jgi:hypothetical protein
LFLFISTNCISQTTSNLENKLSLSLYTPEFQVQPNHFIFPTVLIEKNIKFFKAHTKLISTSVDKKKHTISSVEQFKYYIFYFEGSSQTSQYHDPMTAGENM